MQIATRENIETFTWTNSGSTSSYESVKCWGEMLYTSGKRQKWPFSDPKKWHFEWPNQNSKTTFIVQTFPKYGPYGFEARF